MIYVQLIIVWDLFTSGVNFLQTYLHIST